ncbi:MAG: acyl-CoA dehydrogenase family protein [Anaerolineae bacterium]|jgi:alkylation response protein AidB-like acyl-CoA dehydrogenase
MADNFFSDNADLQARLDHLDLSAAVEILEDGYRYQHDHPGAPRNYRDALDNYRLILEILGGICAERLAPRAAEAAEEGVHLEDGRVTYAAATRDGLALLAQAGLMGATLPWEYGGLNLPTTVFQMMVEILSRADPGLMSIFALQEVSAIIAEHGDDEMKGRILPRFARGEVTGAMVLTEPDAGSDLGSVQTRAAWDDAVGMWRLDGVKRFITNGCADVLLVLARSESGSTDARGLSLFEVEADETVRVRRLENKMGLRASPTCELQFNGTTARLVGKRRYGLIRYTWALMNGARVAVAAQAVGIAEAAYREAVAYARKRVQFGDAIDRIPAVYRMLLSMRGEIEATRALIYETGRWVDIKRSYERLKDRGALDAEGRALLKTADRLTAVLTPLAKYHATEMGNRVCYQALQVHGGAGYMREFDVERHFRDIRVTNIYEGTSQLQIAAATGGLLGRALDPLLDAWGEETYGAQVHDLKGQLDEATALFRRSVDHLKEQDDRAFIDYYAADLADMAVYLLTSWLVLRDAPLGERKRELARVYIGEVMPHFHGRLAALRAGDPTPLQARDLLLDGVS